MTENLEPAHGAIGKVAKVTLGFWIIKIVATTLGETGGDALSMPPVNLGYLASTSIFLLFFVASVTWHVMVRHYKPALYWTVIVATTTLGTTTADWLTRDLKFFGNEGPYYGATALVLFVALMTALLVWKLVTGSIAMHSVNNKRSEVFYWIAILISNTLGTALGDWLADTNGFGFEGGALVFGGAIATIGALAMWTKLPRAGLFWAAFILTRPLGAVLGDIITKPHEKGGLDLSRPVSSLVILIIMVILVVSLDRDSRPSPLTPQSAS